MWRIVQLVLPAYDATMDLLRQAMTVTECLRDDLSFDRLQQVGAVSVDALEPPIDSTSRSSFNVADPPVCTSRMSAYKFETGVSRYDDGDCYAKSILSVAWHPACDVPIDVTPHLQEREVDDFLATIRGHQCTAMTAT
ncbi:hypothetical protein SDRG_12364 [Saprolegnia diclina VS20]|uniref:Uncharacterized protein n=1 Tax=Saprolegnia diclina (strain VS20) TaxID=1156394 RepID=T0RC66_SAPDV|nr:hypothetical protein SDRG_12364 [Saprolegnia diclina VS20]EQC29818.1 hypothetical protein SDRG_12364 [Saprolegnia diclina VS20]|eukprot:XP_008616657.1 hypothetical protein SDRG_12364 [Saprolegnia diclina VS20]